MAVAVVCMTVFVPNHSYARDDGRFANSPLKEWFDRLASKNGLCCAFADGVSVQDVDWDTQDGHYRVRIQGEWIVVPDDAVVTEPNRFGPAVVWPYNDRYGNTQIRCFIPGAGTTSAFGTKRTSGLCQSMSAFGGKADISGSGLLSCKLTPEPHFAGRKSLV
jgi:hypothetical protein